MHKHERRIDYKVGIITVSTSRYKRYGKVRELKNIYEDESGELIAKEFRDKVSAYILVPDNIEDIRSAIFEIFTKADVCIINGGTGVSPFDVTIEAVEPLFTKKLDGFGEIFRKLSYEEIGVDAILSRATAGIISNKVVFCLPGSIKAVKLGLKLIKPVLTHLLSHVKGLS